MYIYIYIHTYTYNLGCPSPPLWLRRWLHWSPYLPLMTYNYYFDNLGFPPGHGVRTQFTINLEHIELLTKLQDYFLRRNTSNISIKKFCWFLVYNADTQLATQLPQRRMQVVRSNKVARKRLTESNGTPAMDLGSMNIDWRILAIEKIEDRGKLETLVQNQPFWNIVSARLAEATRESGRDKAAGKINIGWASPPRILQIHSLHQVATVTSLHVPL